jgi:hypothetical protein
MAVIMSVVPMLNYTVVQTQETDLFMDES